MQRSPYPQDLNKVLDGAFAIRARDIEMGYRVKSARTKRRDQDTRLLGARRRGTARTPLHKLERRNETPLALIASRSRLFAPLPMPHSRLTWRS
jgi:hypothetical protein